MEKEFVVCEAWGERQEVLVFAAVINNFGYSESSNWNGLSGHNICKV